MLTALPGDKRKINENRLDDIVDLTTSIKELILTMVPKGRDSSIVPKLYTWGLRSSIFRPVQGPHNIFGRTAGHRDSKWREDELSDMLHLCDEKHLKMGIACVSYFKVLYSMIPCRARNNNKGLGLEKAEKREW